MEQVHAACVASGFSAPQQLLELTEIGDGNVNHVYRVAAPGRADTVVVKLAVPYFKCAGPQYPLALQRAQLEARALALQGRLAPGMVPLVRWHDSAMGCTVMEDMAPLQPLRPQLLQQRSFPRLAQDVAHFLARLVMGTGPYSANVAQRAQWAVEFNNPQLVAITDELVFTEPFIDGGRNRVNPALRPHLERHLWGNEAVLTQAAHLRQHFLCSAQSVVHGDLHTGSIFAGPQRTVFFDAEFACVGPSAFDLGKFIGNLVINHHCWAGRAAPLQQTQRHREFLCATVRDAWGLFAEELSHGLSEPGPLGAQWHRPAYVHGHLRQLQQEVLGYAAMVIIRRMHGLAQVADVEDIADLNLRARVQAGLVDLACELLLHRQDMRKGMDELTALVASRAGAPLEPTPARAAPVE